MSRQPSKRQRSLIIEPASLLKIPPPPSREQLWEAFLRLLPDPLQEQDAEQRNERVKRLIQLLGKYDDLTVQHRLLRILQGVKGAYEEHQIPFVSTHRSWFKRRDTWRTSQLRDDLTPLVREFEETMYAQLRTTGRLPSDYYQQIKRVSWCYEQLKAAIENCYILSKTFRPRGRSQPYLKRAVKLMRELKITGVDAEDFLIVINAKLDPGRPAKSRRNLSQ
jgi:hypothetical protein